MREEPRLDHEPVGWAGWPAWGAAVLLLAPSLWWILQDQSVWSWDPSQYALWAVDLWRALAGHPSGWWTTMMDVIRLKAPGLSWFGQLFVPLGRGLGSVDRGLLLAVLLAQAGSLVLIYRLARHVRPQQPLAPAAAVLMMAGAPLYVALSHCFMTEAPQLFCVVYVFYVAARSRHWPAARTAAHLVLALALGIAIKLSTPAYVLFPAGLAALRALGRSRRDGFLRGSTGPDAVLAAAAGLMAVLDLAWYWHNAAITIWFARESATLPIWGHVRSVWGKLWYWGQAVGTNLFASQLAWVAIALLAALAGARRAAAHRPAPARAGASTPSTAEDTGDAPLVATAALEIALIVLLLVRTVNEETRYLLPVGPALVILLLAALPARRSWALAGAAVAVLLLQWGDVNLRSLGWIPVGDWRGIFGAGPPSRDPRFAELDRLMDQTCTAATAGRRVIAGVNFAWINPFTLEFFGAKHGLDTGHRCSYEESGPLPHDIERAWKYTSDPAVSYFVSMDPRALPEKLDYLNDIAPTLLERVKADPRFVQVPFDSPSHLILFRHEVDRAEEGAGRPQ